MSRLDIFEQFKVFGPNGADVVDTVVGLLVIGGMREVRKHAGIIRDKGRKAFLVKLGLYACRHSRCAKIPPDHREGQDSVRARNPLQFLEPRMLRLFCEVSHH